MISVDSNRLVGLDMMINDNEFTADLRVGVDVQKFKLSAGIGLQNINGNLSDTSDAWDRSTIETHDQAKVEFVEISHNSGIFLRYSEADHVDNLNFTRSHFDYALGAFVIDNQKPVSLDEKISSYMLGYRAAF